MVNYENEKKDDTDNITQFFQKLLIDISEDLSWNIDMF